MESSDHDIDAAARLPASPQPPGLQQLWQVPAFFLGLVAFGLALALGLASGPTVQERFQRALREALSALESHDARRAKQLAEILLARLDESPEHHGMTRFILGSAHWLEARQLSGQDQVEAFQRARIELRQAGDLGVAPAHWPRLRYRLAAASYYAGSERDEALAGLEQAVEASPHDHLDGFALLVRLHLAKAEPDLQAALAANQRLLALTTLTDPDPVRLERAELLLRLERFEEARQVIARIAADAATAPASRHLLALTHFREESWEQAAKVWEEADVSHLPRAAEALYFLGVCYEHLDRAEDALRAWEGLQREFPTSPETRAAAIQRAELLGQLKRDAESLPQWESILSLVTDAGIPPYWDAQQIGRAVERSWQAWRQSGQFAEARRLAQAARTIWTSGEAETHFALAAEAEGLEIFQRAAHVTGQRADQLLGEARQLCKDAAEAFAKAAAMRDGRPDHADLLWSAAENYLRAQQYTQAATVLDRYRTLDVPQKRRIEALVDLGQAHQALKQTDAAVKVLREALAQPGPFHVRTRYLLALAQIEQGKFAEAEATLRENLIGPATDADTSEFARSLFALGDVLYRRGQFTDAASYLQRAIEQYPADPQVLHARYLLAQAYRWSARQESKNLGKADTRMARDLYQKQRDGRLEQALQQFRQLAFDLSDRQENGKVTADEHNLLRESRFGIGECLFHLGRYQEAVGVYETQVNNYHGEVESLTALMHLIHCYCTLKRLDEARLAIDRASAVLESIDDQRLQATQITRKQWQEWLETAQRSCQPAR